MIWNVGDYNAARGHKAATQWEAKILDLTWTFNDDQPRFRHEKWREVFDEQVKSGPMALLTAGDQLFSLPLAEHEERYEIWLPKEKVWERYNTMSHIAILEGEEREVSSLAKLLKFLLKIPSALTTFSWTRSMGRMLRQMRMEMLRYMDQRLLSGLRRYQKKAALA